MRSRSGLHGLTAAAPRALAVAGGALVVLGFFLPWLHGTAEFGARDFSGFDLARLVRNFEIVASSTSESGRAGATAFALYALPALAVNAAVLALAPALHRKAAAIALAVAAAYGFAVLLAAATLSAVSFTELDRVLGAPMTGFFVSAAGIAALAASAALMFRGAKAS